MKVKENRFPDIIPDRNFKRLYFTCTFINLDIIRGEITWIKPSRPREAKRVASLNEDFLPEYRELGRI